MLRLLALILLILNTGCFIWGVWLWDPPAPDVLVRSPAPEPPRSLQLLEEDAAGD